MPGRPSSIDDAGQSLPDRASAGELQILHVGGAGVGRSHEREHARAPRAGGADKRLERVAAHQRVDGGGVDTEAGNRSERRLDAAVQRLRIGARGHIDVAALAVCDHEQPRLARMLEGGSEQHAPGVTESLEAGKLRLDRHARGRYRVDQRVAVREHGARHGIGERRLRRSSGPVGHAGPQGTWIGVQSDHELGLAVRDARGEHIAEGDQRFGRGRWGMLGGRRHRG